MGLVVSGQPWLAAATCEMQTTIIVKIFSQFDLYIDDRLGIISLIIYCGRLRCDLIVRQDAAPIKTNVEGDSRGITLRALG